MPVQTTPYQTAQDALNIAIEASNDGGGPLGMEGNVLNVTTNAQVLPTFRDNWVYLQQRLISCSVDTMTETQVVFDLGPTANSNPRVNMQLTYNGYFNGATWSGPNITAPLWNSGTTYTQQMTVTFGNTYYVALPNVNANLNQEPDTATTFWQPFNNIGPCLPANLVKPLELWECRSGNNYWAPMTQAPDSISTRPIQPRFGVWLNGNDRIILPPASQPNDIKIKFVGMKPPIISWDSPIMVVGGARALAFLSLVDLSGGRGGPMADSYKQKAEEAISQIVNQTVRKMSYAMYEPIPFRTSRRGRGRGR